MMEDVWKRNEVDSPCIKLCTIHPEARICVGCYRSIDEIGSWSRLTPAERKSIMTELPARAPQLAKRRGGRMGRQTN